jgi:retron-type reverse transcriptase
MSDTRWISWSFDHEQTARTAIYYYKHRYQRRRRVQRVVVPILDSEPRLEQIADVEGLIATFYELKERAGQAPGPDGVKYGMLSRREVAAAMRHLSEWVVAGQYRRGPARITPIPKASGGTRNLRIRGICDRVVAATLNKAMEPLWDSVFLPWSMGFRPGRGPWHLLADLERAMVEQDRWVLAIDDVKKAFDNLIIDDIMADHRRHVHGNALLSLIEVVLRGSALGKRRGIDQGSAYSPACLNLRLHHVHDLHFGDHDPRWHRYADNLAYLCQTVAEGNQALAKAKRLLKAADLSLKGEDGPPKDLRQGEAAQLMGFKLSRLGDRLRYGFGSEARHKLEQSLVKAQQTANPSKVAEMVIRGWVGAYGPALESGRERIRDRILWAAANLGLREACSSRELARWLMEAWDNWLAFREEKGQAQPLAVL